MPHATNMLEPSSTASEANVNPLNVYFGRDSLKNYFSPEGGPPLPLVELPSHLNPFRDDGVRIFAKMMSCHPANNVKAMPAMNLLEKEVDPAKTETIVEYSSGSTVISMSMAARVFHGIDDTRAYLSNKTSQAKLRLMQFFGLHLTLFGGPSQPEPTDERGGIHKARKDAMKSPGIANPNQYDNDANWHAHVKWTGPQILKQLPDINVICAGMGTTGTITGLGQFFKMAKPSVYRLGVCTAPGDRVPGPRSYALLAPVQFPWQDSVEHVEHVGSHDSFSKSLELCRSGLLCGPSSGFNLTGLLKFLEKRKAENTLSQLAAGQEEISCCFLCCDLPYQYIDEYFTQLGPSAFNPIANEHLTKVDLCRYDEAWERPLDEVLPMSSNTLVVDFRAPKDLEHSHMPNSLNIPLQNLSMETESPFFAPDVLDRQWRELDACLSASFLQTAVCDRRVLCMCYRGDTARVATSILRARGCEAESVEGGYQAFEKIS